MLSDSVEVARSSASYHDSRRAHPNYWLEDGSVIFRVQNDMFKVHRTIFERHSRVFASWCINAGAERTPIVGGLPVIDVLTELGLSSRDFEALLDHLYHENPLNRHSSFAEIASVLRASSKMQCDLPRIFDLACEYFEDMFPSGPRPFEHPPHLEEAINLSSRYNIPSIQKGLFYSLVTTSEFDLENETIHSTNNASTDSTSEDDEVVDSPLSSQKLSPADSRRLMHLMQKIIADFTPLLFTPANTPHMACTDVFAEHWMPLVIAPALADGGVYRPLETLERIIEVDWVAVGLCEECVRGKTEEWRTEQDDVWEKIDGWLGV